MESIAHTLSPPVVHGAIGKTLLGGSNVYGLGFRGIHSLGVGLGVGLMVVRKEK